MNNIQRNRLVAKKSLMHWPEPFGDDGVIHLLLLLLLLLSRSRKGKKVKKKKRKVGRDQIYVVITNRFP